MSNRVFIVGHIPDIMGFNNWGELMMSGIFLFPILEACKRGWVKGDSTQYIDNFFSR